MKWWNYFEPEMKGIYKIYSNGRLIRMAGGSHVFLTFEEVKEIMSLKPALGYQRMKEIFEKKHPQSEEDYIPIPTEKRPELEELF